MGAVDLHALQPVMRRLPLGASFLFIGLYMVSNPSGFDRHARQFAGVLRSVHLHLHFGWLVPPGTVDPDRWSEHRLGIRMAGLAVVLLAIALLISGV